MPPPGPKPSHTNLIHPIVKRIRKQRERKNMSRRHVDQLAGVAINTTMNLESGATQMTALGKLAKVAAAVGMRLTVVSRLRLEYDPVTIEAACVTLCRLCAGDHPIKRHLTGEWVHKISGKDLRCVATATREALYEPYKSVGENVLQYHEEMDAQRTQRYITRRRRKTEKAAKAEREAAQAFLDRNKGEGKGVPK